ncbi:hypothetical protein PRIPAC_90619 [Pristionchus pacificus]|nr:hypothetical protein PRIPAC_90619 [Pristionchus pacificus]
MEKTPSSNDSKNNAPKKRADKIEMSSPSNDTTPIAGRNAPSFGSGNSSGGSVLTPSNARVPSTPSSRRGKRPPDGPSDKKNSPKPSSKRARSGVHDGTADPPNTTIQNPSQLRPREDDQENGDPTMDENSTHLHVNQEQSVSTGDPPSDGAATPQPVNPISLANPTSAIVIQTPQPARVKIVKIADVRRAPLTEFNMMLPKKTYSGDEIDKEVEARKDETTDQLMEQVHREVAAANGQGEWKYDYIVSTILQKKEDKNAATEEKKKKRTKNKIVIKGKGYPLPNIMHLQWNFVPTKEQEPYFSYWEREKKMHLTEKVVIKEFGGNRKAFLAKYPYRFSPDEEGVTESEFITHPITVVKNVLRSIEWRITMECDLIHQPPIWFVDWTGTTDRDSLPRFKFVNEYIPSRKVRKAMNASNEYGTIRCQRACDQPCDSALLNPNLRERLTCKCQIIKKSKIGRQTIDTSPVECTDACSCDPTICGNRVIQHGRQYPMQVWKDWRKGWTLRTLSKIKKGDYVGEYLGEVITFYESQKRPNWVYYMDMPTQRLIEDSDEKDGRKFHYHLVIDAREYGNETRFISHSCDPNLTLVTAYVERIGGWYARMAFIAKRDIAFGEELTFDYFPNYKEPAGDNKYEDLPVFESCFCESEKCKFKFLLDLDLDLARKMRKQQYDEMKKASALEADSWDEDSDTEEKKVERLKKQRASRKDRNEKRNNLKARTEEEEAIAMAIGASESEMEKDEETKEKKANNAKKEDDSYKEEEDDDDIVVI